MAKLKRLPRPAEKRWIEMGYLAGFMEAIRLQNGLPKGIPFKKVWTKRKALAAKAFKQHYKCSVDSFRRLTPRARQKYDLMLVGVKPDPNFKVV